MGRWHHTSVGMEGRAQLKLDIGHQLCFPNTKGTAFTKTNKRKLANNISLLYIRGSGTHKS